MPVKSTTSPKIPSNGSSFQKTIWIDCELTEEHKKHLKSLQMSEAQILKGMEDLVLSGHKVTFAFEEKNDCVAVYCTAPKEEQGGPAVCLSARGPSLEKAMMVLQYKHYELLQGDWSGKVKAGSYIDPWG